jgi:hypothetical protein
MTTAVEIPVVPSQAQRFAVTLGGVSYNIRLTFNAAQGACWILDIGDADGNLLVAGIPLVSGVDLLAQYRYLGIAGALLVTTDRGAGEVPAFDGLGVTSHLFYLSDA